ncbi:unnamed protein product, partial [Pocillopora meandrina]
MELHPGPLTDNTINDVYANDVNNDSSNLQQDTIDETSDNEELIHNEIPQDESESTAGKPYIKQTDELDIDGLPLENFIDDNQNDEIDDKTTCSKTKKRTKARIIRSVWFNREAEPKKHYRELLMLFTSWRNEETDLLGSFSSYQDRYMLLSDVINEQMKQYAVCNEDFNEIQQEMNRIEDRFDEIAPCAQSLEQQDKAEGDKDLHPDFDGNYNLSDDLGIP